MSNGTEWLVSSKMRAGGETEKPFGTKGEAEAYAKRLRELGDTEVQVSPMLATPSDNKG